MDRSYYRKIEEGGKSWYADDKDSAIELILSIISDCMSYNEAHYHKSRRIIGFGDSQTLHEISLFDNVYKYATNNNCSVINPFERLEDGRYIEFQDLPNGWNDDPKPYEEAYLRVMEKM